MPQPNQGLQGSFRIFQVLGISVYVHWSWFVVALLEFQFRDSAYTSRIWIAVEYLAFFGIVLIHEFGHAFACRQVGGQVQEILLSPLGGVAYINPPPRPGPTLWSFVAGPLVNIVLVPISLGVWFWFHTNDVGLNDPDVGHLLTAISVINALVLVIHMLPIYPLDGGQILHALLWFVVGRAKSLFAVSILGIIGAVAIIFIAIFFLQSIWIGILAAIGVYRCWQGFQQARILAKIETIPRHRDAACPSCDSHPLIGDFWQCADCGLPFDPFRMQGECPHCGAQVDVPNCMDCGNAHPIWAWYSQTPQPRYREDDSDFPDTNISR